MTGSQCATPVASTINFTESTGLFVFDDDKRIDV